MTRTPLTLAYIALRIAAFVCITTAIVSAFVGLHVAGPLLLSFFAMLGIGGLLNVWLGLVENRVLLGLREVTNQSQPAVFWLWFVLNVILALVIGIALIFILIVRYS